MTLERVLVKFESETQRFYHRQKKISGKARTVLENSTRSLPTLLPIILQFAFQSIQMRLSLLTVFNHLPLWPLSRLRRS